MALIVQKFGGTSVGSLERIQRIADKVIATREKGQDVVVVVSAMEGETDRLIGMAKTLQVTPEPPEYSALVSTGEQVSAALLAMALSGKGYKACSLTGGQAGVKTSSSLMRARILDVNDALILQKIQAGFVPVIAGFQGLDADGNITTLGRGGSDTSAVAIAVAICANECQIFTDVDGVYTTDPRIVSQAKRLSHLTFEEMLELSSMGAKVLQIRSVEFASKYNMPIRVLSSFQEGEGTLISNEGVHMEKPLVSGIAFNRSQAKLTIIGIPDKPGIAAKILKPFSEANIDIDMILQNVAPNQTTDLTFTVERDEYNNAFNLLREIGQEVGSQEVRGDARIAKLTLVGVGMRSHTTIASRMFAALGREGINIQMIATSEIKVSVVVDEKYLELGVRTLHTEFGLDASTEDDFKPAVRHFKEE